MRTPRPHVTDTGIDCVWSRWTYVVHVAKMDTLTPADGWTYDVRVARCGTELNAAAALHGVDEHLNRYVSPCRKCFRGVA